MKIMQNAKKVRRAVLHGDLLGNSVPADLQKAALKAIRGGRNSDDWKKYMAIFADNEAQLQRLLGNDAFAAKPWFEETTAYLVSNGVCVSPSTTRFTDNINPEIDDGLDPAPAPAGQPLTVAKAITIDDPHPETPIP